MSIDQILEEEATEFKRRVKARIQAMLLGNSVGRPIGTVKTPEENRTNRTNRANGATRLELVEKAVEYIKENPGCGGREIMEAIGVDINDHNLRISVMDNLKKKTIRKGESAKSVYYIKGGAPSGSKPKGAARTNRTKEEREAYYEKIGVPALKFILANPGADSVTIGREVVKTVPESTSDDRFNAYNYLIEQGRIRADRPDKGIGRIFYPL